MTRLRLLNERDPLHGKRLHRIQRRPLLIHLMKSLGHRLLRVVVLARVVRLTGWRRLVEVLILPRTRVCESYLLLRILIHPLVLWARALVIGLCREV